MVSIGKYNKTIHNKFTSIHFKHHKIKISGKYTPYKVRDLQVGSDGVYLIKHINHKYNKHNKRNEPQESKEVFGKAKKDYAEADRIRDEMPKAFLLPASPET